MEMEPPPIIVELDFPPLMETLFDVEIYLYLLVLSSFGGFAFLRNKNLFKSTGPLPVLLSLLGRSWIETALVVAIGGFAIGMIGMTLRGVQPGSSAAALLDTVKLVVLMFALGGVLAGLGYCVNKPELRLDYRISGAQALVSLSALTGMTLFFLSGTGAPYHWIFNAYSVGIYLSLTVASILLSAFKSNKSWVEILNNANITGTLSGMGLGMVLWFVEGASYERSSDAIFVISCILAFGCYVYVTIYIYSLYKGGREELDFPKKSWHMTEAASFFIFLVYAPVGATEYLRESTDQAALQEQHDAQQLEINQLKAQIKLLTEKVGEV
jgi:hypothetical protein